MERNRLGLHSICMDLDISKLMGYFTSSNVINIHNQYIYADMFQIWLLLALSISIQFYNHCDANYQKECAIADTLSVFTGNFLIRFHHAIGSNPKSRDHTTLLISQPQFLLES